MIFNFDLTLVIPSANQPTPINQLFLTDLTAELSQRTIEGKVFHAGQLIPKMPVGTISISQNGSVSLAFELNAHRLTAMEKLREFKDLQLVVALFCNALFESQPKTRSTVGFRFELRIPKSDWAETYLPQLGFKTVSLIEISQSLDIEFSETIKYLNEAWKTILNG